MKDEDMSPPLFREVGGIFIIYSLVGLKVKLGMTLIKRGMLNIY